MFCVSDNSNLINIIQLTTLDHFVYCGLNDYLYVILLIINITIPNFPLFCFRFKVTNNSVLIK